MSFSVYIVMARILERLLYCFTLLSSKKIPISQRSQLMKRMVNSTLFILSALHSPSSMTPEIYSRSKCTSTDRHSPQQRRPNPLPEPQNALRPKRLRKRTPHAPIDLLLPKPVGLHFTLDDIKRITGQPKRLTRQPTVSSNLPRRDLLAIDLVPSRVGLHHVLEGQEPGPICLRFSEEGDGCTPVQTVGHACVGGEFADAIYGAIVEFSGAVWLGLETDADVFDWC